MSGGAWRRGGWVLLALVALGGCSGADGGGEPRPPLDDGQAGTGTPTPPAATPGGEDPPAAPEAPSPPANPGPDTGTPAEPPPAGSAGPVLPQNGPVETAGSAGWRFLGSAEGVPSRVFGASVDAAGNLWVAGGDEGVAVLRAGEERFRRHGLPQRAISIAGGAAGVAYVGYEGLDGCESEWDNAPHEGRVPDASIYKSGDADRLVLSGEGLGRAHYDIFTGPGRVANEPQGREKVCTIHRILHDARTRSVWFGGNHGVSWGDPESTLVVEHTHPAINGYRRSSSGELNYTLLTGSYRALAVDARGDLWLGGSERSALFRCGSYVLEDQDPENDALCSNFFWTSDGEIQRTKVDVWPDAVPQDPRPEQAVEDNPMGFALRPDGTVWVGSRDRGLAVISTAGKHLGFYTEPLVNPNVLSVALDPLDGSVWLGHRGGGLTRLKDNRWIHYTGAALGRFAGHDVVDLQVDTTGARRRLLVSFARGGVGVYEGD